MRILYSFNNHHFDMKKAISALASSCRFRNIPAVGQHLRCTRLLCTQNTVDSGEIERFAKISSKWWDNTTTFRFLKRMNKLRVPFIVKSTESSGDDYQPLNNKSILDVGCGGGLLSEPLARLGGTVTGLDATQECIDAAENHKSLFDEEIINKNLTYVCSTVEQLSETKSGVYDVVIASEVIEHVSDRREFIKHLVTLTKPGGSLVLTTINRTNLSYLLGIQAAENLFSIVEPGTHEWEKFVTPEEMRNDFKEFGCSMMALHGIMLNPVTQSWFYTPSTDINYMCSFIKPAERENNS